MNSIDGSNGILSVGTLQSGHGNTCQSTGYGKRKCPVFKAGRDKFEKKSITHSFQGKPSFFKNWTGQDATADKH